LFAGSGAYRHSGAARHASTNLKTASSSLKEFVTHLVPKSVFEALGQPTE